MPDGCPPEYERVIAKVGALLPYARARTLLAEFLPLGDLPAVKTTRRRTLRVGARLEQQSVGFCHVTRRLQRVAWPELERASGPLRCPAQGG